MAVIITSVVNPILDCLTLKRSLWYQATVGGFLNQFIFLTALVIWSWWLKLCCFCSFFFRAAAVVLWCLNVSMWQHAGVTVINPFPPQSCHLHNKATIPDAKASPHVYCYNYLTFKSTLMSPGWSHSLSSFGFRALLLSNKVTFHNTASPWNTHPLINIHLPASARLPIRREEKLQENKAVGGHRKAWVCISSHVDREGKSAPPKSDTGKRKTSLWTIEVLLNYCL